MSNRNVSLLKLTVEIEYEQPINKHLVDPFFLSLVPKTLLELVSSSCVVMLSV